MSDKVELKKLAWLDAMAKFVVQHGLGEASLRPLAKAAGTSDRMLIYHFNSKENLIFQVLEYAFDQLGERVKNYFPESRAKSRYDCAITLLGFMDEPEYKYYMRLWLEVVANSAQNEKLYSEIGQKLNVNFEQWLIEHLPEDDANPQQSARAMLTLLQGIEVQAALDDKSIGRDAIKFLFAE